jgi:hypothetical protein
MKRALTVFSVLAVLGFSGFAMGTFSGKWDTNLHVLPGLSLDYTKLILNYTDFGWTFTSISKFDNTGYVYQKFGASGAFGPFTVKSNMWFDPTVPAYEASDLSTTMDFAGLSLGLTARHWVNSYWNPDNAWYPDTNPCPQTGLQYILTAKVDPISIKLRFADCCTGTAFQDLLVDVTGIGLCCGISLNSELYFTKAGFNYVQFSGINIPLCCGVSLDIAVEFGVDYKAIYVTPKFAGLGEGCFTVYAVPEISGTDEYGKATGTISWLGIDVEAWAIECKLGDCNYIKFVTALDPGWYNNNVEAVFDLDNYPNEFEYAELGFCGAGCCGGKYTVDLSVYFQPSGSLFGITRLGANMSIPVMSNFTVKVAFDSTPTLDVGWVFTF